MEIWSAYVKQLADVALQFAQIFGIVLPGSDRRDPLLAAGNAASIDISVFDAILPGQITQNEIPKV